MYLQPKDAKNYSLLFLFSFITSITETIKQISNIINILNLSFFNSSNILNSL